MALLDLPTELFDNIIAFLHIDEAFERLALTSKACYDLCELHISRYNTLKRWRVIRFTDSDHEVHNVLAILRGILRDPDVAYAIEELDLRNGQIDRDSNLEELSPQDFLPLVNERAAHWVEVIFSQAATLRGEGDQNSDNHSSLTILLLILLPNLTGLTLPEDWSIIWDNMECCAEILQEVANWNRHKEQAQADLPLNKLKHLRPHEEGEYDPMPRTGLASFVPFLLLPSLTDFHATNVIAVDDGYTGISFEWSDSNLTSKVRNVNLEAGCIDGTNISRLLEHTPHLQSLTYSHHTKWHGCQHDWDAGAFSQAIANHRGDTLTHMRITLDCLYGDVETGIVSLKDFHALQIVSLDLRVFCAPPPDSGTRLGLGGEGPQSWTVEDIPKLENILPSCVRSLELISRDDDNDRDIAALRSLLDGPKKFMASTELPDLEKLTITSRTSTVLEAFGVDQSCKDSVDVIEAAGQVTISTFLGPKLRGSHLGPAEDGFELYTVSRVR